MRRDQLGRHRSAHQPITTMAISGRRNQMTQTPATRTETSRAIIRQAFDAWRQGTGAITDVFAPDMVWRIEGHSAASKEYRSKQHTGQPPGGHGPAADSRSGRLPSRARTTPDRSPTASRDRRPRHPVILGT